MYENILGEAHKVEVRFRGSKGDQGRRGAIIITAMDPSRCERGVVELLVELNRTQGARE